ncbi:hypothetical protein [Roseateles sp. P5_E7]
MPNSALRRVAALTFAASLAAAGGAATAACNSSFADDVGQVITATLTLNINACNLTYLVVRESGSLTLFDQVVGTFINGASDLSGNTWVQDAGLDNWGLLTNGARGSFHNVRQLTNRGTLQNDGTFNNLLFVLNYTSFINGASGVMTNAVSGNIENYGDLTNQGALHNDGTLNNYARVGNEAGVTLVSQGQFNNRTGGALTNDGITRLLGTSVLEAGSTLTNTSTLDIGGRLLAQGQIANSGVVNVLADGGDGLTLAAGASYDFTAGILRVAGTLTLEADFTQTAAMLDHLEMLPGSTLVNRATYTPNEWASVMRSVTFRNEGRLAVVGYFLFTNDIDHQNAYFDNAASARVDVAPAGILAFGQPTSNSGVIDNRGTLYISQSVTNQRGGQIFNAGYMDVNTVLWNDGQLTNTGTVKVVGPLPFHGLTGSGSYLQTAGTTQVDGDMAQGGVRIEGGRLIVDGTLTTTANAAFPDSTGKVELIGGVLSGTGLINGELFVGGGPGTASFKPAHSPGTFTIHGGFTLLPGGVLELEVERSSDGQLAFDFVKADHMLLNGTVLFKLGTDVGGASLAELSLLDCGSGCEFGSSFAYAIEGGGSGASVLFSAHGVTLSIPAAIPEPATLALWLAGLLVLGRAGSIRATRART